MLDVEVWSAKLFWWNVCCRGKIWRVDRASVMQGSCPHFAHDFGHCRYLILFVQLKIGFNTGIPLENRRIEALFIQESTVFKGYSGMFNACIYSIYQQPILHTLRPSEDLQNNRSHGRTLHRLWNLLFSHKLALVTPPKIQRLASSSSAGT